MADDFALFVKPCFAAIGLKAGYCIGRRKGKDLVYAGKVDHGFDTASAKDLQARLKPLIRKTQPYARKVAHKAVWVKPDLLAEIEYRAKSAEGKVRHPGMSRYFEYGIASAQQAGGLVNVSQRHGDGGRAANEIREVPVAGNLFR